MADFRKALQALGAGKLNPIVLAESIDKLLTQQPQLADALLNQLAEARTTGVISEEQYAAVRECITSLSYNPAKRAPPQDTPRDEHLEATLVRTDRKSVV